jgi:hypothetical protein
MSTRASSLPSRWPAGLARIASAALLSCLLPACTKFASEEDRPEGEEELAGQLTPSALDWSCVPRSTVPPIPVNMDRPITYSLIIGNFVTSAALPNAQVRACFTGDVTCSSPATSMLTTNAQGAVQVTLFEGFSGYLEITAEGMLPTLAFFPANWSADLIAQMEQPPVGLLPALALMGLAASARIQIDATSGLVSLYTYDCGGPFAAGVRLETDSDAAVPYAFVSGLPVIGQDVTSEGGIVGFVNVQPGIVVVRAYPDDGMQALSVDTMLVRPGWLSIGRMIPSFAR